MSLSQFPDLVFFCLLIGVTEVFTGEYVNVPDLSRSTTFRFDINFLEPHFELLSRSSHILVAWFLSYSNVSGFLGTFECTFSTTDNCLL